MPKERKASPGKKKAPSVSFTEAVEMLQLSEQGYSVSEIAEKFNRHPVTVTRKINELRKALRNFSEKHIQPQEQRVSRTQKGSQDSRGVSLMNTVGGDGKPFGLAELIPKINPLEAIEDRDVLGKAAFGAAMIPGSAIHLIARAFNDDSLSIEEKIDMAGKGADVAVKFALGLSEVLKSLSGSQKKPEPKNVPYNYPEEDVGGSGYR